VSSDLARVVVEEEVVEPAGLVGEETEPGKWCLQRGATREGGALGGEERGRGRRRSLG
jgi:hypothetical protein